MLFFLLFLMVEIQTAASDDSEKMSNPNMPNVKASI
ncbi:hypothetical protein SEEHRA23_06575 [Salmonella enterica subsp. enterica serovar Heidelberg str. SARA33]|nr:hypothetical protein SEEHRA23_06575 [Salmonella enterica subsp. enterica serovar Heidelberg str. SARA33]